VCQSVTRPRLAKRLKFQFGPETFGGLSHTILDGVAISTARGKGSGEILLILKYINTTIPIHLPDGATFDAAYNRLLCFGYFLTLVLAVKLLKRNNKIIESF